MLVENIIYHFCKWLALMVSLLKSAVLILQEFFVKKVTRLLLQILNQEDYCLRN